MVPSSVPGGPEEPAPPLLSLLQPFSDSLASPKSSSFTRPRSSTITLAGFTSRCTTPAPCAAVSASATWTASSKASRSDGGPAE